MLKAEFKNLKFGDLVIIRDTSGRFRKASYYGLRHGDWLYNNAPSAVFKYIDTGKPVRKRARHIRGFVHEEAQVTPDLN